MTWAEVWNFVVERERLRWTIRYLRMKLAFVQARRWWRNAA